MNRTQKLKLNSIISVMTRIATIISGLILPRLIISNYGAETHGLVNSITQFLGIITFLDLGVGSVVKSALYRPLVEEDEKKTSAILTAANNYFKKIAYALIVYIIILIVFYPYLIDSTHDYLSTILLIVAISISQFGRYYFGIVNELLLSANQQDYIQFGSEIVVIILNLIISVILINQGSSIEIAKLGSGLIYLIRPLYLSYYVSKNFNIELNIELEEDPLPQRWSGMGQHIAYSIQNGSDVVILTLFATLENISVYSVYNMVVTSIKTLLTALTSGIQSFFGDLYARNEIALLNNYFDKIEWIVHTVVIFMYGMAAVLINPFVMIYTSGVGGISYEAPLFSLLLVVSSVAYSLRTPYRSMIFSAGHFKQTQRSSFIEAGLNIVISIVLVRRLGLVGLAVGTLVSMAYRTLYLVFYLSDNIVFRPVKKFAKHIVVDFLSFVGIIGVGMVLNNWFVIRNFFDWFLVAVILGVISIILILIINLIFYKGVMLSTVKSVLKRN